MTPDPELLRVEFLGLTARHDPVDMPREDLALFFASISDRYGLARLEYHSDGGATFPDQDGAEFVLRHSQTASCAVTGLGYREGLERVVGLLESLNAALPGVGFVIGAVIATVASPRTAYAVAGIGVLLLVLLALILRPFVSIGSASPAAGDGLMVPEPARRAPEPVDR